MSDSLETPLIAALSAAVDGQPCGAMLDALAEVDPYCLPASAQVDALVVLERHAAWIAAMSAEVLVAIAGEGVDVPADPNDPITCDPFCVDDPARDEIAVALRISGAAASDRLTVARDLLTKLRGTFALLAAGEISYRHAVAVSQETERVDAADARIVERDVLGSAHRLTAASLRRRVRRAVQRLAPQRSMEELEAEFAKREVKLVCTGAVMATIVAELPAPDALQIWNALTACATAPPVEPGDVSDRRTLNHKRADALLAWANQALDDPGLPTVHRRRRLETQVVIELPTLLGMAEEPAELVGYGPIPASYARELAADSSWRRLVTDSVDGYLLDFGHDTYSPPAKLRDYLLARHRACAFPGCGQPSSRCDLDHVEPYTGDADGGQTSAANLHPLCRRHHRLKTHHNWRVEVEGINGHETTWTSPRGRRYGTDPPNPFN